MLGVGGGFILVPALRKYTPLPMQSVAATSLMVLTVVPTGGALQWLASTGIDWAIGGPFVPGAIAGMAVARGVAPSFSEAPLRRIFSLICLLGSLGLLFKVLAGYR